MAYAVTTGTIMSIRTNAGPKLNKTEKWLEKCRISAEANFQKELKKIEEDAIANAWRPRVSNNPSMPFQVCYWTLGRYNKDDTTAWRKFRKCYDDGWVGLTVNNLSPFEKLQIKAFFKEIKKIEYLTEEDKFGDSSELIGSFDDVCFGYWFKNVADHNRFVKLLEEFPKRNTLITIGSTRVTNEILNLISKKNYLIVEGNENTILSIESDEEIIVFLRMLCAEFEFIS